MLSVSGLHVGIIAGAVRTLVVGARARLLAADLLSLGVTIAFVAFIGAPPPAMRSGAMLVLGVVARVRQRPTSPWGNLGRVVRVPLWEPRVVLDLGWQLSVAGMAGLLASGTLVRRATRRTPRVASHRGLLHGRHEVWRRPRRRRWWRGCSGASASPRS